MSSHYYHKPDNISQSHYEQKYLLILQPSWKLFQVQMMTMTKQHEKLKSKLD